MRAKLTKIPFETVILRDPLAIQSIMVQKARGVTRLFSGPRVVFPVYIVKRYSIFKSVTQSLPLIESGVGAFVALQPQRFL